MLTPATSASMLVAIPTAIRVGSVRLDVDTEKGEHGEAQPVVPGRNIPVHGACKQKTQHGHQELTGPGGQGELDSVAQTLLLNEQAVGERHDESVHGEGKSQEDQVGKRHAHCGEAL